MVKYNENLEKIYYFSAFAYHIEPYDPETVNRHKKFIKYIKDTGISVEINRFKGKWTKCNAEDGCKKWFKKHEEKETDVVIAKKLLEIFMVIHHKNCT